MNACLEVQDLSKSFTLHNLDKHIDACSKISFTIREGEFVGITGRSGSGKSTILKLVNRSYLPQSGAIWYQSAALGRVNLCTCTERQIVWLRRHEIGYVSQFLSVIPRTSARELVEQAVVELGKSAAEAKEEAVRMLRHFELDQTLWDSYPATFSGGEKLRLNIARAMAKHPRLLLLDEPTASLDVHAKTKVRELIQQLKTEGTTMLGIFHDIEFMEGLCDHEFNMQAGSFKAHSHAA